MDILSGVYCTKVISIKAKPTYQQFFPMFCMTPFKVIVYALMWLLLGTWSLLVVLLLRVIRSFIGLLGVLVARSGHDGSLSRSHDFQLRRQIQSGQNPPAEIRGRRLES